MLAVGLILVGISFAAVLVMQVAAGEPPVAGVVPRALAFEVPRVVVAEGRPGEDGSVAAALHGCGVEAARVGLLAALMIITPLSPRGEVSFLLDRNTVSVIDERLSVDNAMYRGRDNDGRPFSPLCDMSAASISLATANHTRLFLCTHSSTSKTCFDTTNKRLGRICSR